MNLTQSPDSLATILKKVLFKKDLENLVSTCSRFRIFDPSCTLFCFIFQVVNRCSEKAALLNLNLHRVQKNEKTVSINTAAYNKAKSRLCIESLKNLTKALGTRLDSQYKKWRLKDRDVLLVDGSVIKIEDSEENKNKFPISKDEKKIWGPPRFRILSLFSYSSGAFLDLEIGKHCGKGQAETSLLRTLIKRINKGSIIVMDRFFTSFDTRKCILNYECDFVIRARDEKAKKMLGKKHDLTFLEKPIRSEYGTIPMKVRLVKSILKQDGYRDSVIYIMTSLFKENGYSKKDIEDLYSKRWSIELDFRNLKTTLEARKLRSKSPDHCIKELWVHLLAYNMVKAISNNTSNINNIAPRKQSFKIYVEVLKFMMINESLKSCNQVGNILEKDTLNSKYRREPRYVKWADQKYKVLKIPRSKARIKLATQDQNQGLKGLDAYEAA